LKSFRFAWFLYRKDQSFNGSLILLVCSLAFGIGALVSLDIFTRRVGATLQSDSKSLLGADFQIQSWRPFSNQVFEAFQEGIGKAQLIEHGDFVTSMEVPELGTFTVAARSVKGDQYTFYGNFETRPALLFEELIKAPFIVLDSSFEARGVKIGDPVRLGNLDFEVVSFLIDEPGSAAAAFAIGLRVLFHQKYQESTGLTGRGARVFRRLLVKTDLNTAEFEKNFKSFASEPHWRISTPEKANRQAERVMRRIRTFLSLVGLTGLFLSGVGLLMIFRSEFTRKLTQLLTLRCLGVSRNSLIIYSSLKSLFVSILGILLGVVSGYFLERYIVQYASRDIDMQLAEVSLLPSVLLASTVAVLVSFVAAVLPLMEFLRIPVSHAIQQSESFESRLKTRDFGVLFLLSLVLAMLVNRNFEMSFWFLISLLCAAFILALIAWGFSLLLKPIVQSSVLVLRHAYLNLIRKPTRTQLLLLSLGIGLFLLQTVFWVSISLRKQLDIANREGIPNVFLLNVGQSDIDFIRQEIPNADVIPVSQARLIELEDTVLTHETVAEEGRERFYQTREYVFTRRNQLAVGERIVDGETLFSAKNEDEDFIRVSLEREFANSINFKLGTRFKIDVSGVSLEARVDSLRSVDWYNFQPNFFMVFSEEDLAEAPMDYVAFGRVEPALIPNIQKMLGLKASHVSILNGDAIAKRLNGMLEKLSFSIFCLTLFSLASCVFVFVGVALSRIQDFRRDVALWRCFGLKAASIRSLFVFESLFVVMAACLSSLMASSLAVFFICEGAMKIPVEFPGFAFFFVFLLMAPLVFTSLLWLLGEKQIRLNAAAIWRTVEM